MDNPTARALLKIGAVFFRPDEPFIWASGIKSPVYCDNRLILTAPDIRSETAKAIAGAVSLYYPGCELLMGTATAGIAHAALAAHLLGLPMGYVRGAAKGHGRGKLIEGKLDPGQKTVVVEDLISTGGSVVETVKILKEAGADVLGVVSIFTYAMKEAKRRLEAENISAVSLVSFDEVIEAALAGGYIGKGDPARLLAFRDNPSDESWIGAGI